MIQFKQDDGGRAAAGYKGKTGDCVCRAIAIATEQPYQAVYSALNETKYGMRQTKHVRGSEPRSGMFRKVYDAYLKSLGWEFVPCMGIGTGCHVHLCENELPKGRIICRLSKHVCAVVDGVIHDTYDPSRGGKRCVYGYYRKAA